MRPNHTICILLATTLLAGCATYVNIPAQPGDVAVNNPNIPNVSAAIAEGLHAIVADQPIRQPFRVVLFDGTAPDNAHSIIPKISRHAVWDRDANQPNLSPNLPTVQIRQLLIRDTTAQVHATRPAQPDYPHSGDQLVTAYLTWDLTSGWTTTRIRTWRVDPATALRKTPLPYSPVSRSDPDATH